MFVSYLEDIKKVLKDYDIYAISAQYVEVDERPWRLFIKQKKILF